MIHNGFITLQRKILDWEWYTDTNTTRLFIHLILMANHKDNNYRGTVVKRGELLTSYERLNLETGLSRQNLRTSLKKLVSTNDITIDSTNKGTSRYPAGRHQEEPPRIGWSPKVLVPRLRSRLHLRCIPPAAKAVRARFPEGPHHHRQAIFSLWLPLPSLFNVRNLLVENLPKQDLAPHFDLLKPF